MDGRLNDPAMSQAGVCCRTGCCRLKNEDNFYLDGYFKPLGQGDIPVERESSAPVGIYAVCDGMGGQNNGAQAAWAGVRAVALFHEALAQNGQRSETVTHCITAANQAICGQNIKFHCEMGSTFLLAVVTQGRYEVYNLGDSRAYLWNGVKLCQVSRDHTQEQELKDMGLSKGTGSGGRSGGLTQYLGFPPQEMLLQPHVAQGEFLAGWRLLLCSDGLTDMLSDREICEVLSDGESPISQAKRLVHHAEAAGGRDNVTALVVGLSE